MKLKTIKSISKRVRNITSRGKILRRSISVQHLAMAKAKRTRRGGGKSAAVSRADYKLLTRALPYGKS